MFNLFFRFIFNNMTCQAENLFDLEAELLRTQWGLRLLFFAAVHKGYRTLDHNPICWTIFNHDFGCSNGPNTSGRIRRTRSLHETSSLSWQPLCSCSSLRWRVLLPRSTNQFITTLRMASEWRWCFLMLRGLIFDFIDSSLITLVTLLSLMKSHVWSRQFRSKLGLKERWSAVLLVFYG